MTTKHTRALGSGIPSLVAFLVLSSTAGLIAGITAATITVTVTKLLTRDNDDNKERGSQGNSGYPVSRHYNNYDETYSKRVIDITAYQKENYGKGNTGTTNQTVERRILEGGTNRK